MKIKAHAKINLSLAITNKREDGYHDIKTIMVPIALHDLLYIDTIPEGIVIGTNSLIMPTDERNIIYKIIAHMQSKYNIRKGVKVFVYKHIPMQAGLAGGSTDGAAVIRAVNQLFRLHLSTQEMMQLGREIGADIPFCVYGKKALVQGIGEKIIPISQSLRARILLVKPKKGVSTKKAFANVKLNPTPYDHIEAMKQAIKENRYKEVVTHLHNDLEVPSKAIVPEIEEIKQTLLALGFDGALMSGSGSCVFGITRNKLVLEKGYQFYRRKKIFVCKSKIINK